MQEVKSYQEGRISYSRFSRSYRVALVQSTRTDGQIDQQIDPLDVEVIKANCLK